MRDCFRESVVVGKRDGTKPGTESQVRMKRLFVGGLSWNTTSEGLREAFERFGSVNDAIVITDRDTGRSRGFGFVTMDDDDAATSAAEEMDGANLDGRTIRVNEAHERGGSGGGGGGGGRGGGRGGRY